MSSVSTLVVGILLRWSLPAACGLLALCPVAAAHEGPPYPIVMDRPTPQFTVSVWGDPDVGEGTFYIVLEPRGGASSAEPKVSVWVQPVTERLPKAAYPARRQELRGRMQFYAVTQFDRQEMWNVGFVIEPPGAAPAEIVAEVEATPPGLGPWDLLIYSFPFVALGGLWAIGLVRRWRSGREDCRSRSERRAARPNPAPAVPSSDDRRSTAWPLPGDVVHAGDSAALPFPSFTTTRAASRRPSCQAEPKP